MSLFDQLRQRMAQQQGGAMTGSAPRAAPGPVSAPMGLRGRFDFVPQQFQQAPIPPGLSPGMLRQAQFERMPIMPRPGGFDPLAMPQVTNGNSFTDRAKMLADMQNRAQLQMQRDMFQQRIAPIRNQFAARRQMLMQRPMVGGFGYGNLDEYVRRMQTPGLGY